MTNAAVPTAAWLQQSERGALWAMRAASWVAVHLGRPAMRLLVRPIAFYYLLFDGTARRSSQAWLTAARGRPPSRYAIYKHLRCFAQATADRLFLLRGATACLRIRRHGNVTLQNLQRQRRGALLLGSHLGSFEALRVGSRDEALPVHFVAHFANAKRINTLLAQFDPGMAQRVIAIGDDPLQLALTLKERIDAGGMLAILADRLGLNGKAVQVDFFGRPTRFPAAPLLLAAALKCPVLLVFALYSEPNVYDLHCEPFAERIVLPRAQRQQALQSWVQAYAARLEVHARRAPENWFNFYDFWADAA